MIFEPLSISNIMHEYEQTRLENNRIANDRRQEIYSKYPDIEAIDTASTTSYISSVLDRINGKSNDSKDIRTVSQANRSRTLEKKRLLVEAGYPADYLDPLYTCPICKDTGYVNQDRCKCFKDKIINKLYLQSNLSNILEKENFQTFRLDYYSKEKRADYDYSPYDNIVNILNSAKAFVDNFGTDQKERGNILIYGEVGLGKTFLTNCIAKAILDKGHQVLYVSANELFQNIFSPYLMNQEKVLADLYKYVYNCELLIIDDLGTELANTFTISNLFELINQRNIQGHSTVISTNLGLKELKTKYSERIMSRLIEGYTVYNIYGDNIRYQKRFNNT